MTRPAARPLFVGIAGGTASGKTSLARRVQEEVRSEHSVLIELDSYYRDLAAHSFEDRKRFNFDHPDAFDWDLLREQMVTLLGGEAVSVPLYDYALHTRKEEVREIAPRSVVILEGILTLWPEWLREMMNVRIFVDIPDDLRLLRRLRRDIVERGRDVESVLDQFEHQVRPMHLMFCEPTKRYADVIIPRGGHNRVALEMLGSLLHRATGGTR